MIRNLPSVIKAANATAHSHRLFVRNVSYKGEKVLTFTLMRHHVTRHNDTQHIDIQHIGHSFKRLINNTQHQNNNDLPLC
jgi:hypothetical protein